MAPSAVGTACMAARKRGRFAFELFGKSYICNSSICVGLQRRKPSGAAAEEPEPQRQRQKEEEGGLDQQHRGCGRL